MHLARIFGLLALSGVQAAPTPDWLPNGVLHFPLKRSVPSSVEGLRRRADTFAIELEDHQSLFTTELEIGSDGQKVSVQVDTGSSDLWVMATNNPYCAGIVNGTQTRPGPSNTNVNPQWRVDRCQASAMFNDEESSTFSKNNTAFSIRYGDQTFANGTYAQDDIKLGGVTIKKANFALAEEANSTTAVWGIGLEATEATVRTVNPQGVYSPTYSNLPSQMKEQGLIGSVAYSLWLNDINSEEASLLFGGIDHTKYSGSLQTVPIVSNYRGISNPNEFRVMLHSVSLYQGNNNGTIIQCSLPFLLDSGTTFMMLPGQFIQPIIESIGAVYSQQGYILAPCNLDGGLTFDFSGVRIDVPFSQMTLTAGPPNVCALGIMDGGESLILGDTFLRSVYAVYDLENKQIALAKPVYNVSSSSVEAISSGIPSATQAPSYSSTQVQNSIITSRVTFFGNAQASGGGAGAESFGTYQTTPFSETDTFSGLPSSSVLQTGSVAASTLATNRKNGGVVPSPHGQSSIYSLFTGVLGLLLYI